VVGYGVGRKNIFMENALPWWAAVVGYGVGRKNIFMENALPWWGTGWGGKIYLWKTHCRAVLRGGEEKYIYGKRTAVVGYGVGRKNIFMENALPWWGTGWGMGGGWDFNTVRAFWYTFLFG